MSHSYHTIIIGGGAAGLMCAATLLERSDFSGRIAIIERNAHLGAKVIISGGGRCNVTTGHTSIKQVLAMYPRGSEFLAPILKAFTPKSMYRWFEEHGVPLKIEKDMRVFPVSDDGHDIVGVFEQLFHQYHDRIDILLRTKVESVQRTICSDDVCRGGFDVITSTGILKAQNIVIATGGQAYRHTGSTGDGYAFAQGLGHTITPLGPSLSSFQTSDVLLHGLSGLSFTDARITVITTGESYRGPVLLTHFGISGPLTFIVSSHTAFDPITDDEPLTLKLAPHADHDSGYRYDRLTTQAHSQPQKLLSTIIRQEFSDKFVHYLFGHVSQGIDLSLLQISQLSKIQKSALADLLGNGIALTAIKRRAGDEFVTAGGVSLDQVSNKDCQSTICPGLYLAGEVLDIDGYTGGYNLTSSWATGRRVGISIN